MYIVHMFMVPRYVVHMYVYGAGICIYCNERILPYFPCNSQQVMVKASVSKSASVSILT